MDNVARLNTTVSTEHRRMLDEARMFARFEMNAGAVSHRDLIERGIELVFAELKGEPAPDSRIHPVTDEEE